MPLPFGTDPVQWLRKNLLTLDENIENPPPALIRDDGTVLLMLVDVSANFKKRIRHRRRKGLAALVPKGNGRWWTTPTTVWGVTAAPKDDPRAFPAYICPWETGEAKTLMLRDAADVMFTGDMIGCTFGVGVETTQGGVLVGHANANAAFTGEGREDADYAAQWKSQRDALSDANAGDAFVDPADYRTMVNRTHLAKNRKGELQAYTDQFGTLALTVGLRFRGKQQKWHFYYQHQVVDKGASWREGLELVKVR
jgi:hypothetical protein